MSDVLIREARPDELQRVGELTVEAYRVDGYLDSSSTHDYAREVADAADRAKDTELLVAEDGDGELVGTVTVVSPGSRYAEVVRDGELEIRMLAVAPTARGRGIGAELTRAVLRRAAELGRRRVVLSTWDTRVRLHRLYERLGFRRVPELDWQPTETVFLICFAADVPAC